jgi:cell division septation protein DedD
MNKEGVVGLFLFLALLGGIVLFARRPVTSSLALAPNQPHSQGNINIIPIAEQPRHYQNKETRRIEYNADNLPTLIEITRDYTIT